MTPFKATKGTVMEGGFRVPCIARWPGHIKPGTVENGIFSGLDWFPTLAAAAGNPDITDQLLKGVKLGDRTYKNHLDGYNQMDLLEGKGPSKRHELFYFGGPKLGAVRLDDMKFQFFQQPQRLARPEGRDRHAHDRATSARTRSSATPIDRRRDAGERRVRLRERFLRPRVLAVRPRPGEGGGPRARRRSTTRRCRTRLPSTWMR